MQLDKITSGIELRGMFLKEVPFLINAVATLLLLFGACASCSYCWEATDAIKELSDGVFHDFA